MRDQSEHEGEELSRRNFLKMIGTTGGAAWLALNNPSSLFGLEPTSVDNPLESYPNTDWEQTYRDQYKYDDTFTYICAPNDTHMCRIKAFTRNGVMVRMEQNYEHQDYEDLYGNASTEDWNPRMCLKGYTMHRRVYGPYRAKGPALRKGWKEWADAGFPSLSDNPDLREKYRFDDRGNDGYVRVSWDEAAEYAAKGMKAIAETYSGPKGKERLKNDGATEKMFEHWHGAGTRTFKIGSNLPIHGIVGKFGLFRFANLTGLLDHHVRGVSKEASKAARDWTEYTWRGDQAPGQPFVHGLQASDCDFNDLRNTELHIQIGKNLVENKMPDSHWFIEMMERGGKIVSIAPEYNAPATKADYWIPVRPGLSDTSILLYLAKYLIDENLYDEAFVKQFSDFPLLVRTDTLERLQPSDFIKGYKPMDLSGGPSYEIQGLTEEQRQRLGDFVVYDETSGELTPVSREEVGEQLEENGINPALNWTGTVTTTDGKEVEVMTLFEMYKVHLQDYDLDTVAEITESDRDLIRRLAEDLSTIQPAAIHHGEGINHYFHATEHNRAVWLPMILTGQIGTHGAGVYTWAGNYKGALMQGSSWSGPGAGAYVKEDPFNPVIDPDAEITKENLRGMMKGEEVSYWASGDREFTVDTPGEGEKTFTGHTHMPTPTKLIWTNNANFINQAKHAYNIIHNINPQVDMIVDQQIEWTGSAEYSDVILPANSWPEFEHLEAGASCSNPFLQLWGKNKYTDETKGIDPLYDTLDDGMIFARVSEKLSELTGDDRFAKHWKYMLEGDTDVYLDRVFESSTTTSTRDGDAYTCEDVMNGEYGVEGGALMLFRTYPRVPFWEQVHDSVPFYTDTGRLNAYCDIPEAIEYGENFIVHREGPEATPYLPNVIVSSNPYIRPEDYGIPKDAMDADLRQVRNIKMPWEEVRETSNPLHEEGFQLFCSTPKSRHSVHSSWSVVDWHWRWGSDHADYQREDKRLPGVGDRQIQLNPEDAKKRGLENGDYVYVDANPDDRPFIGWEDDEKLYNVCRCMVRVKYNPALPSGFTIMKHTGWMATEATVRAQQERDDGRALTEETGYQASYRTGSQQSITKNWMMPMHQTDNLFHKKTVAMGFTFGFAIDNHAINTVPKETLVKITKAESGGKGGEGTWEEAKTGFSPADEDEWGKKYLEGSLTSVDDS